MKSKSLLLAVIMLLAPGLMAAFGTKGSAMERFASAQAAKVKHTIALELPLTIEDGELLSATATLTNVQTTSEYGTDKFTLSGYQYKGTVSVPEGTYNIHVTAKISYKEGNVTKTADALADMKNVSITPKGPSSTTIALNVFEAKKGLVITELFYTSTMTPEGHQYSRDQYIKIGNNSDEVQYLDGVAFMESKFWTIQKEDYKPDILEEAMAVGTVYVFPGSGKDHPLEPGKEVLIAVNAANHKELNPNSFDLSKADFELYDVSSNPAFLDTDNPDVPNMVGLYKESLSYFAMNNRGFRAYALAVPEVSNEDYVANYRYDYTYDQSFNGEVYPMSWFGYKMPNSWIIDAVNCSVPSMYVWNVTSATLDAGYTYCGQIDHDQNRYGKSVIRKKENGKWVKTNNSSVDFIPDTPASLIDKNETGITAPAASHADVKAVQGGIIVSADRQQSVSVYTTGGQQLVSTRVSEGSHRISLNAGLYIVRAGDKAVKVVVE